MSKTPHDFKKRRLHFSNLFVLKAGFSLAAALAASRQFFAPNAIVLP